ncbi:MAG: hypothetical protein ACRC0R_06535 [Cetobacterium sp.]
MGKDDIVEFTYNLLDKFTKLELDSNSNKPIESNPYAQSLLDKDIKYDSNGLVAGISDFVYENNIHTEVANYFGDKLYTSLESKLEKIIPISDVNEIVKYANQGVSLIKFTAGALEHDSLGSFTNTLFSSGSAVDSLVGNVATKYGLDGVYSSAKSLLSTISSPGDIMSSISNNANQAITSVVDGIMPKSIISVGGTSHYGDKIPGNRELMILTIANITTGNTYKSISFEEGLSDSQTANWEKQDIVGRTSPVVAFNNSSSSIDISIRVVEDYLNKGSFEENLNVLRDLVNPMYIGNLIKKPVAKFSLGGLSRRVIVDSVSVDYRNNIIRNGKHTLADVSISMSVIGKSSGKLYSATDY